MCSLPRQPAKEAGARVWIGVDVIGHPSFHHSFIPNQCESVMSSKPSYLRSAESPMPSGCFYGLARHFSGADVAVLYQVLHLDGLELVPDIHLYETGETGCPQRLNSCSLCLGYQVFDKLFNQWVMLFL